MSLPPPTLTALFFGSTAAASTGTTEGSAHRRKGDPLPEHPSDFKVPPRTHRSLALGMSLCLYGALGAAGALILGARQERRPAPPSFQAVVLSEYELPAAPPPPPAPGPHTGGSAPSRSSEPAPEPQVPQGRVPDLPKELPLLSTPAAPGPASADPVGGEPGGAPGGMAGGVAGGTVGGVPGGRLGAPIPPRFLAAYLNNPAPEYPPLSRKLGEEGRVVLRVLVSPEGRPSQIEVKGGSGSARLDQAAVETVRRWRFVPARLGDEAVSAWVLVPISFHLDA